MANDAIYVSLRQVSNINYSRLENSVTNSDTDMNLTVTVSSSTGKSTKCHVKLFMVWRFYFMVDMESKQTLCMQFMRS